MSKKQGSLAAQLPESVREFFRECGRKGGRPATVPHVEGWKGCRCAECRRAKEGAGRKPEAEGPGEREEMVHVSEMAEWPSAVDVLDQIAAADEPESEVPADMMLVSEMAERSGYSEEDVWKAATGDAKGAHPRRLADGRRVVDRAWGEMKLKKMGRA